MGSEMWTFLFTDVEGSTRLWEQHPGAMGEALKIHDVILRQAVEDNGGHVFKHTGDGVAASFASAMGAVRAAITAQRVLATAPWPPSLTLKVRMGVHPGEAASRDGDFFGVAVNKAARLMGVGHGGQVLVSEPTSLILDRTDEWGLKTLGQHRLRDLAEPLRVVQLLAEGLPGDFPQLRTLDAYRSNLPRNLPAYVGREEVVDEIEGYLRSNPLVTIAGIGGAGKTRLSQQVGAQVLPQFEEGVWFVDLAPLGRTEAVDSAVARVLGIAERTSEEVGITIADALHDQQLLIVLDNCEQVTASVAILEERVTATAPGVRCLATSREPIGVYGEKVVRLVGLDEDSAVSLFVARADEAGGKIDLELQREVIGELCRRLDGLPLAIELAAARSKSMTPAELLERIDERFRILKGSERRIPRHRTLEAMVDWSYRLLTDEERLLLNRLAVFVGSFDLASTEEICADDRIDRIAIDELLDRLVDKSLVAASSAPEGIRLRLLETVRQFAARLLAESGEADMFGEAHVRFFSRRARTLAARIHGANLAEASAATAFDLENLNAAIDRLGDQGRHNEKAQMVSSLALFWNIAAPTSGLRWYEELVEAEELLDPETRLAVGLTAAEFMSERGRVARAHELLDRTERVAGRQGLELPPYFRYVAALVAEMDGRVEDAIREAEAGLHRAAQEADDFTTVALRTRMLTSLIKVDPVLAMEHARKTLDMAREQGIDVFVAAGCFLIGTVHALCGRIPEAAAAFEEAIAAAAGAVPQIDIASKITLAAAYRHSSPEMALRLAQEGVRLEAETDVMPVLRVIAGDLVASIMAQAGRLTAAAEVLAAGDALRRRMGFKGLWWGQPIRDEAWNIVAASLDPTQLEGAVARGEVMAEAEVRRVLLEPAEARS